MEIHIIKQYYSVRTPCKTSNWVLLVILIILFLNKRDKLWLNRQEFLVLYFCVATLS